ncbi:MAG: flagellin [Selenomonas sp.]|uniref:flagellin n=1 Tax=Selenomonas sp. TaxID=2053611 RepID=UPI0025D114B5|nr:flagellin [Selenomonas sp.]MCI6231525.1 flagellin [Selenomonas sp.]
MAMVVKNNLSAKNTLNQLNKNEKATAKDLKKLASGMRINSAADDASGYSISERMAVQIRSLDQDDANTQNGTSLLKTAEGAVSSTVDILKTLKEKAINAANDSNTDEDRKVIQKEVDQALEQIDDNANVTFNGLTLVDGSKNDQVIGDGTSTHLTNENFADGTNMRTELVNLTGKDGQKLGIMPNDQVTISYVKDGKTWSNTIAVDETTLFGDMFSWDPCQSDMTMTTDLDESKIGTDQFGNDVYTIDGRSAITYRAAEPGLNGQIAGLTISVADSHGQSRNTTNTLINDFRETIRAQDPSQDNALVLQTGTKANQSLKVGFTDLRATALGLKSKAGDTIQLTTQVSANASINAFDNAVSKALDMQTKIGAVQSRLSYTSSNIVTASENTTASKSTISDADMAKEMTSYTKNNVLTQAAQAMLAQANQSSSSVLSLLQ